MNIKKTPISHSMERYEESLFFGSPMLYILRRILRKFLTVFEITG